MLAQILSIINHKIQNAVVTQMVLSQGNHVTLELENVHAILDITKQNVIGNYIILIIRNTV